MASNVELKRLRDQNEIIQKLSNHLEMFVSEEGVKLAVILLDKESSKISFASAFPRNEKLMYANVRFASASSGQVDMNFEYKNDEKDEKKDDMIRQVEEGFQWHKVPTTIINLLKSMVPRMTSEELKELKEIELMEIRQFEDDEN